MSFYMGVKKVLGKFLMGCFYRCSVEGGENIPEGGRLLVCSNHISLHDPIVIAAACNRQICYMSKKELFKIPLFGSFLKSLGAFPVDRKGGDVGAIRHSIFLLNSEHAVGIFPQGTRHPKVDPEGTPIQKGAGMLVDKTDATVLPVFIHTKKHKVTPFFGKVVLRIGKPVSAEELKRDTEGVSGTEKYNVISKRIFEHIIQLK